MGLAAREAEVFQPRGAFVVGFRDDAAEALRYGHRGVDDRQVAVVVNGLHGLTRDTHGEGFGGGTGILHILRRDARRVRLGGIEMETRGDPRDDGQIVAFPIGGQLLDIQNHRPRRSTPLR